MSTDGQMSDDKKRDLLAEADRLREDGRPEEARERLLALTAALPDDAEVAYRTAWVHDTLGLESEAVPYYERALGNPGLGRRTGAGRFWGWAARTGSWAGTGRRSRRCAGASRSSRTTGALRTFLAMALFNTDEHHEAMRLLLEVTAATSQDPYVQRYRRAIEHYAKDLDETV
ncbi:tetratricopeptide repeat protein [Streptomyces globisporus]|uniref:Tetratricopeptide repeat protein n=1 Tax=Streptomyces globisporus TaxID=1908 RepID=A0A927BML5_STRGL|nr:tetratricopeptide repeat protein [Streptomyces globisporus]